ncbi:MULTISPECIES: ABC transporter substrate-binding protein [Bradyrhizobium]|nr:MULTISPECIES: ABC transporter substrate-binding protein [Bradyrhizobium]MCG2632957.1 ABC transporter substrate-binding protein [Bradyrhizobium zhengyangense]MCG2645729.1 ABC transporter substrate-binding protein [Bradyrhizobium zhengyangense]MCG2673159.1 ABC transporter substrate-binding protein [Bradyrhizobium zhengyangense]MDN4988235.1 ABC transporter substrate-binding protein [Bradyrhizobium sp. WYCCWR 13022]MDN5006311.1 ABC transporter substrate-binding protein [Bradyrhizobium sp. WYCCW
MPKSTARCFIHRPARLKRRFAAIASVAALLMTVSPGGAETLKWARSLDVQTLDPHAYNENVTFAFNRQMYEGLVERSDDGKLIGVLATEWRMLPDHPDVWEFKLRRNVTFHDGAPFKADDAAFSIQRAMAPTSNVRTYLAAAAVEEAIAKDDYTVQVKTKGPSPLLPENLASIFIMNRAWAEKNDSVVPQDFKGGKENYAARHENGTGAYRLVSRESDRRSELEAYDKYWGIGQFPIDIDRIIYTPIQSAATRVSALISGEVNFLQDVPPQDISRLEQNESLRVVRGPEIRTVFLGVNTSANTLASGEAKGNPFADKRVRHAMNMSIDRLAIKSAIMRGESVPLGTIISPIADGYTEELGKFPKLNIDQAKQLMAEAGYPNGFSVTLNCPNDGMVNDERICQAVVAMLAKIGVTVHLDVQPSAVVWPLVLNRKTDFYLMTWGSYDSQLIFDNLVHSRGAWAAANYKNPEIDAKIELLRSEADPQRRKTIIAEIWKTVQDECFYLPIHAQVLARATQKKIHVTPNVGNQISVKTIKVDK